jgi:hypothetical protein
MNRFLTMVGAGLAAFAVLGAVSTVAQAKPAPPGPGNSAAAHACQNGGWQNLVSSGGQTFASQDECVAYAAQGGVLAPKPTLTFVMTNCVPYTNPPPGFDEPTICDTYTIAGVGLLPGAQLTRCDPEPLGCRLVVPTVNPDGTFLYQAPYEGYPRYICVVGSYYSLPTAYGGTVQSQPQTCPVG